MSLDAREAAEAAATAQLQGREMPEVITLCLISLIYSMIEIAEALTELSGRSTAPIAE